MERAAEQDAHQFVINFSFMLTWKSLENRGHLDDILSRSATLPQLIFKHSTRCSISSMAKNRLEREAAPSGVEFHFLDLIRYRGISNEIAEMFDVMHESPQVILIKNGESTYSESHNGISMEAISQAL